MSSSRVRLLLILMVAPILCGGASATYEIAMFRMQHFNPELEPIYVSVVPLVLALLGGAMGFLALATATRSLVSRDVHVSIPQRNLLNWLATGLLGLACFLYVVWRAMVVDSQLVMQFGYCCCCASEPVLVETIVRVLNPAAL